MRRVSKASSDVFRPKGQLKRELELASGEPEKVAQILGERLSEERKERIERVLSHRTRRLAVAVEGVHDPHNTAAVIRSADAMGVQTVHVIENGISFLSSRKVTQGTHKWIDLGVWRTPDEFAEAVHQTGHKILIAAADGERSIQDISLEERPLLVFGNEAEGISDRMREVADGSFRIPMVGFVDSFNVSVAAAISMSTLRLGATGDLPKEELDVLRARYYLRAVRAGYEIVQEEFRRSEA